MYISGIYLKSACKYSATYLRCIFKDVADDFHGGLWREDVGVPHHELLQDVVLYRAC